MERSYVAQAIFKLMMKPRMALNFFSPGAEIIGVPLWPSLEKVLVLPQTDAILRLMFEKHPNDEQW